MRPRFLDIFLSLTIGAAVVLGCLQPLTAQNPAAQSPVPPLSIIVAPQQKRLHQHQPIDLQVQVVNTSKTAQSFQVMTCRWQEEWHISDPRLYPPNVPCGANALITITLAPGEAYKKELEMYQWPPVGKPIGPGKLYFRVGFTPNAHIITLPGQVTENTYWSAPVMLDIIK